MTFSEREIVIVDQNIPHSNARILKLALSIKTGNFNPQMNEKQYRTVHQKINKYQTL